MLHFDIKSTKKKKKKKKKIPTYRSIFLGACYSKHNFFFALHDIVYVTNEITNWSND